MHCMHPRNKPFATAAAATVNLGFQIAPMIDVVFVIMLFFMVMAGALKAEYQLRLQLPGRNPVPEFHPMPPDEVIISLDEAGHVQLNDASLETAAGGALPELTARLRRLQQAADDRQAQVLVTIQAEEQAAYGRVIDVLNVLAKARLNHATFVVGREE